MISRATVTAMVTATVTAMITAVVVAVAVKEEAGTTAIKARSAGVSFPVSPGLLDQFLIYSTWRMRQMIMPAIITARELTTQRRGRETSMHY